MIARGLILISLAGPGPAAEPDLVLPCPGEWITTMTVSPDGNCLVAGSDRGVVRVWKLLDPKKSERTIKEFPGPVTALVSSPDAQTVVAGTWEGTLVKLDLSDGTIRQTYEEHRETITALGISPDGQYLASGSADDRLIIWDLQTGEDLLTMEQGNDYDVTTLAFSPDGKTIATGDGENQIKLWNADTGDAFKVWQGHQKPVSQVLYGQKGQLISGSWDRTIRVWDSKKPRTLRGHLGEITALQVAGAIIYSGGEDGTVREWPPEGPEDPVILTEGGDSIRCLVVGAKGKMVLAGTRGKILAWSRE